MIKSLLLFVNSYERNQQFSVGTNKKGPFAQGQTHLNIYFNHSVPITHIKYKMAENKYVKVFFGIQHLLHLGYNQSTLTL